VRQIPDFPANDWEEFKQRVESHEFTLGMDYSSANHLAPDTRGGVYRLWVAVLVAIPYLAVGLSVLGAVTFSRLRILLAIPPIILAFIIANPLNPLRRAATVLCVVSLVLLGVALIRSYPTLTWLCVAFATTFIAVRALYWTNTMALRLAALASEPLFLFLFERKLCTVRDNRTGKVHVVPTQFLLRDGA